MAPKKLWRPVKEWLPHEWAIMDEAWSRVYESLSKDMALTQLDVKAHLLAGRLVGAARVFAPDGTERCIIILDREFWQPVEILHAWYVIGWEQHRREGETWRFFVRRRELDQLYPVAVSAEQTEPQQPVKLRRPPGPPPKKDWPQHVAFEVGRIFAQENRVPTAPEMLQWCEDTWGWQPDLRQMQRLLKSLLDG